MKNPIRALWCLLLLGAAAVIQLSAATPPFAIGPDPLPPMTAGVPYSVTLTTTGATLPCTWAPLSLVPGLSLDPVSGVLSGKPSVAGNQVVYVKATDAQGLVTQKPWQVKIATAPNSGGGTTTTPSVTVTVVNGTFNGGLTSAAVTPGTVVTITANPPPPGQWLQSWSGNAPVANPQATTTTFTMGWSSVVETANYYTPPPLPQVAAGHPRLWVRQADIPRLRQWAVPSNTIYQQGLRVALNTALLAHSKCFPNGQPASPYPDGGDKLGYAGAQIGTNAQGGPDLLSEQHELLLAFMALVDPDPNNRLQYAQKARDMLMYQMNESAKGHLAGAPFRDPLFILFNRPHTVGESWPLIVDWLQGVTDANGQPVAILTAQDRRTIRDVFMMWANDCLNAYICGGDHPAPIGTTNSTALLPGGSAHRVAANNYYSCHARLVTMMPLALDGADDPAVNPSAPDSVLGNTLRSYLLNATGAWLYQQFALYGDPETVRAAFHLPASSVVGLSSGGLPAEGGLYGHSYGYVLGQLLALQSAGITDPAVHGPQINLLTAPVWDRYVRGSFSQMVNSAAVYPALSYAGPVYQMASWGDLLRLYITPDLMQPLALLALMEQQQGSTAHLNAARWMAVNGVSGGAQNLIQRVATPWNMTEPILYFMLFDPTAPAPTDPRPAYATTYYDAPQARLIWRSGWSPSDEVFVYRAAEQIINHVNCDAGQFELWRNGEWLFRELSNYDGNGFGQSSIWHNTLCIRNWCSAGTPQLNTDEVNYWPLGSSWNNGMSAGAPVSVQSSGPGYVFVQSDLTKVYNRPSSTPSMSAMDVQHASRSLIHLNRDTIVVYDRARTLHAGFKRFNLNFITTPVIDPVNRVTVETTPKGQKLRVQTLLPANATIKWVLPATNLSQAELDPTLGRIEVEDPTTPLGSTFLHVLQAADNGTALTQTPAGTLIQSTSGDVFQGAQVANSVVLFAGDITVPFTGTSYTAAPSATTHYVTGLAPSSGYSVAEQTDGAGNVQITITPGGTFQTDSAGVLAFQP